MSYSRVRPPQRDREDHPVAIAWAAAYAYKVRTAAAPQPLLRTASSASASRQHSDAHTTFKCKRSFSASSSQSVMHTVHHIIHDVEESSGVDHSAYQRVLKDFANKYENKYDEFFAGLSERHPDLIKSIATKHAASLALRHQREVIKHLKHEGVIMDLDAAKLLSEPLKMMRRLDALPADQPISSVKNHRRDRVAPAAGDS